MENLKEQITLEVDKDRLRIFIASFPAAAPERLFARANVDVARPSLFRAQALDGQDKIARDTGEISRAQLFERERPRAALHNDPVAPQPRHVRRAAEKERVKAEWNEPGAGE